MRVYALDGIGSDGIERRSEPLSHLAHRIGRALNARVEWVPWNAAMMGVGGDGSWRDNSREAVAELARLMGEHDETVVLVSFSGGSKPAHDFLDRHPNLRDRVAAVGFLSDPWRPHDRWQHGLPDPGGYGVCGERYTPISDRAFWTTVPGDVIPNAEPDSLLRYGADVSYGNPDQIIRDAIETHRRGRFQLAAFLGLPLHEWFFGLGRRIRQASDSVWRYLNGWHGEHYLGPVDTGGGDTRSLADRLADTIVWAVKTGEKR